MDHQSAEQSEAVPNIPNVWRTDSGPWMFFLWLVACVWLIAIIPVSLVFFGRDLDDGIFLRFGFAGLAGFWFACGQPWWWIRLLVVTSITLIFGLTFYQEFVQTASFVGVTIGVTAGITYAVRMLLSYGFREDNQHHSFSIAAMMQITVVAALVMLALRYGVEYAAPESSLHEAARILFYLTTLGFSLATGCMPLWARCRRTLVLFYIWAFVCLLITLVVTAIGSFLLDEGPDWFEITRVYLVANAALWSLAVPLRFVLRSVGWNLIREDWMERAADGQTPSRQEDENPWPVPVRALLRQFFQSDGEIRSSSEPNWPMIGGIVLAFFVFEGFAIGVASTWERDYSILVRLGQIGLLGFWLACGRARWWLRCLLVVLVVPLLGWLDRHDQMRITLLLILSLLLFAGMTFGVRFVISLWNRASNQHHTTSIKGIMLAMLGAALVFLVLRAIYAFDFQGSNISRLVLMVLHITILGATLVIQGAALWAGRNRFPWWWAFGGVVAVLALFTSYGLQRFWVSGAPLVEWLEIYGIAVVTIWLSAYPFDWALRKAHWSLTQPYWDLSERQHSDKAGSTRATKPQPAAAEPFKPTTESVDFDDIF